MMTPVISGNSSMDSGGAWKRFGPMNENGDTRSENTGSVNQKCPSSFISMVE
ncbi:hypothetical protein D3C71_2028080 [compost metagenome]